MTALLIDLYGVLLPGPDEDDVARVEAAAGVSGEDARRFWEHYRATRPELDAGDVDDQSWWQRLGRLAGPDADMAEVAAAVTAGHLHEPTDILRQARELLDANVTCAILANIPLSLSLRLREKHRWLEEFHAVIFSCDIALAAPDPRVFAVATEAMRTAARDTLFVSADSDHVAGAQAIGMRARLISPHDDLKEFL